LAAVFPSGSAGKYIQNRMNAMREEHGGILQSTAEQSLVDDLLEKILEAYTKDPHFKSLPIE
jgi:intracellular multiplication protein IcmB